MPPATSPPCASCINACVRTALRRGWMKKIYYLVQYRRQLWGNGRLKSWMNGAQSGDVLKNISQ